MLQSLINSVPSLTPQRGHILVVGDIWIDHKQTADLGLARPPFLRHNSSAGLAMTLGDAGLIVTLVGFVGDDSVADAIEQALQLTDVNADLLHIKAWETCTSAHLDIVNFTEARDGQKVARQGRRQRRHKDEKALPIDGMSEYESHLQNRAERYVHNAGAMILVDYGLGSIAEPRALLFVAKQLGVPCIAVLGAQAPVDRYTDAEQTLVMTGLDFERGGEQLRACLPESVVSRI